MKVMKRNGEFEHISFDKVLRRVRRASHGLSINPDVLSQQVLSQIYDGLMSGTPKRSLKDVEKMLKNID